jgi:hypothetical protein
MNYNCRGGGTEWRREGWRGRERERKREILNCYSKLNKTKMINNQMHCDHRFK